MAGTHTLMEPKTQTPMVERQSEQPSADELQKCWACGWNISSKEAESLLAEVVEDAAHPRMTKLIYVEVCPSCATVACQRALRPLPLAQPAPTP